MSLQSVKTKLSGYQNLFKYENAKGQVHYYAEIIRNSKRYGQKNLTKLFDAKTPKQAEKALHYIYSELDKGNDPFNTRSEKLDDLFEEHLKKLNEPTKTTKKYQYDKWIKPRIGHLKIGKITEEHIWKIMEDVDKAKNQPSTKLALKELLTPIFRQQYERKHTDRNVLSSVKIKVPKKKFKIPTTLDEMENEIKQVHQAIHAIDLNEGNTRALFLAVLLTGRRIGELGQLVYSDIDFETGWVNPRAETTKTLKHSEHLYKYKLPPSVLALIEPKNTNEQIFTHHKASYIKRWGKMLNDTKINRKYTAHKTRHFFTSIMGKFFETSLLGEIVLSHAGDINSVYNTISDDRINEIYEKYWNLFA
jgi:integrase